MSNSWKITIPVMRSEDRPDGRYIIGEASGPEKDGHGSRMDPDAIVDFARQISNRVDAGNPIPYIDQHMNDGVLRELGHVMEGSVGEDYHLTVGVRLDAANPASNFLYNNLKRGKQYGMSVAGDGTEYRTERDDDGNKVITFVKVILREISNTTRPSWVPSFGTVLARSLEPSEGITTMTDNATPVVETIDAEAAAPEVELTAPTVVEAAPEVDAPDTTETVTQEVIVERARIAAKDSAEVATIFADFAAKLTALGIDLTAVETSVTPEAMAPAVLENSETGDETIDIAGVKVERELASALTTFIASEIERSIAPLKETVEAQKAYIDALEKLPAGKVPAPIIRDKFETEAPVGPDLSKMSPGERLHYGLSGVYGNV